MKNNGTMDVIGGGKMISMRGVPTIEEAVREEAVKAHNEAIDGYTAYLAEKTKSELAKAEEVTEKMNSMEIKPMYSYILVKPYAENPYQKIEITGAGLIIPKAGDYTVVDPTDGVEKKEENFTVVANVIEVGPTCKYVQAGDDIYYRRAQGVPVPFFRQGFEVVDEHQIQVVINEGLAERFKNANK